MFPENVPLIYGNYEKSFEGSARSRNQHVSLRSDELLRRSISTATRQLKVCLPDYMLFMLLFLVIAFLHAVKKKKKEDLSSILSVKWIFVIVSLLQKIFFLKKTLVKSMKSA